MKRVNIIYWIVTGFVAAAFLMSAFMYFTHNEQILKGFEYAGFPLYFIPFLGVAKAAGAIGILQTQSEKLKEWAYAGLAFNLIGAIYLHIAIDTPFVAPLVFLLLVMLSYFLYHKRSVLQRGVQLSH